MNRDIMREGLRWKVLHIDRDKMNGRQIRDIVGYRYENSGGGSMRQKYWQQRKLDAIKKDKNNLDLSSFDLNFLVK